LKRWTKILIGIAVALVALILAIPLFVNANTFRPTIEKQLTQTLGRAVTVGDISLSVLHGSLVAKDLSIAGDPAFSASPFLTAKQLRIGVAMRPLIFSHQVNLRSFEIESPQINIVRAANGIWNFSTIGHALQSAQSSGAPLPDLTVGFIGIHDGRASITMLPAHGDPSVYDHLNLTAHNFSFASSFPFELAADLPAGGTVKVTGHAGPLDRTDAATSPADVSVSVKGVDPVAAGFLNPSAGVSVVADIATHAASDGKQLSINGTAHLAKLKLRKGSAAAPDPVDISFSVTHRLKQNTGMIQDAAIQIGNSAIHITGTYQPVEEGADDPMLALKLAGQGLPIDNLQQLMTATGIRLPNNSKLHGGAVSLNLAINGQAKALTIAGPIAAENTRLVGFDVGSKIHGVAALSGMKTGDTTDFQKLRADVHITNAGVTVKNIDAIIPAMGELTGEGTVSAADQLDFNLLVKITNATGVGKVGVGLLTALNGGDSGKKGVPLKIVGTPDEPVITADVSGIVGKKTKSITGFFKSGHKDK
jgi:AsmA protein